MEKDIFNIDKNKLSYGRGYVYSLQYHLVWCTKYRKKVLKNGIDTECKEMLQNLADRHKKKAFQTALEGFFVFVAKHPILPVFARLTRFSTICVNRCAAAGIVNCGNCPPRRPSATMYRSHPAAAVRKHGACRRETERGNRVRQWKGRRKGRLERYRKG